MGEAPDFNSFTEETLKRLLETGQFQTIVQYFEITRNLDARLQRYHTEALFELAMGFIRGKDFEEATKALEHIIDIDDSLEEAWYLLGYVHKVVGNIEEAISHFNKTLILNPEYVQALYSLGSLYSTLKQHDKAIEAYTTLLQYDPRNLNALNNLGVSYMDIRDYDKAEHMFRQILEIDTTYKLAMTNLELILLKQKRKDEVLDLRRRYVASSIAAGKTRIPVDDFGLFSLTALIMQLLLIIAVSFIIAIGIHSVSTLSDDLSQIVATTIVSSIVLTSTYIAARIIYATIRQPETHFTRRSFFYTAVMSLLILSDIVFLLRIPNPYWIVVMSITLIIAILLLRATPSDTPSAPKYGPDVCKVCGDPVISLRSFSSEGYCSLRCELVKGRFAILGLGLFLYALKWTFFLTTDELIQLDYALVLFNAGAFAFAFVGFYTNTHEYRTRYESLMQTTPKNILHQYVEKLHSAAKQYPGGVVYEMVSPSSSAVHDIIGFWKVDDFGELTGEFNPNPQYIPVMLQSEDLTPVHPVDAVYNRILSISEIINEEAYIRNLAAISIYLDNKGDFSQAMKYIDKGITFMGQTEDKIGVFQATSHKAMIHVQLKEFQQAQEQFLISLEILHEIGQLEGLDQFYKAIGLFEYELGNAKRAEQYFRQQHEMIGDINSTFEQDKEKLLSSNLFDYGIYFYDKHQYNRALDIYQQALQIAEAIQFDAVIGLAKCNIGVCYTALKDVDLAMQYHEDSLQHSIETGDMSLTALNYYNLGSLLGARASDPSEYEEAKEHFDTAISIYKDAGDLEREGMTLLGYKKLYVKMGDTKNAEQIQYLIDEIHEQLNAGVGDVDDFR